MPWIYAVAWALTTAAAALHAVKAYSTGDTLSAVLAVMTLAAGVLWWNGMMMSWRSWEMQRLSDRRSREEPPTG